MRCVKSNLPCRKSRKELQFVFADPSAAAHTPAATRQRAAQEIARRLPTASPFGAPSIRRSAIVNQCCTTLFPSDPTGWTSDTMSIMNVLQGRDTAADTVALAASYRLVVDQDPSLRAYSLEAYCRAVSQMRFLAMDFKKNWRRLLESSLLLFLYEVSRCSAPPPGDLCLALFPKKSFR